MVNARPDVEALLQRERRVILGITGPPGSGKSTVAVEVVASVPGAVWVPMDGFHLADVELERLGRSQRKGAIDTFDGHGYLALLARLRAEPDEIVYAPAFDRTVEQPVAGSIPIPPDARLIVTEGNYLLDDAAPWPSIRDVLTQVWYVDADPDVRRQRLLQRHIEFGKSPDHARAWMHAVDEPNAVQIEGNRHKADAVIPGQT